MGGRCRPVKRWRGLAIALAISFMVGALAAWVSVEGWRVETVASTGTQQIMMQTGTELG